MIPEWLDWLNKNMPEMLRRELWEHIRMTKAYREDNIHRLREALVAAEAWIVDGGYVDTDPSAAEIYIQTRTALQEAEG